MRLAAPAATAAQVHAALLAEGHAALTLSEVRKACSKAAKQLKQARRAAASSSSSDPARARLQRSGRHAGDAG